jgi:hypothetical protein
MTIKRKPRKTAVDSRSPPVAPAASHAPTTDRERETLVVERLESETSARAVARKILRPSVTAALALHTVSSHRGHTSVSDLIEELSKQCGGAIKGDLGRGEAMLMAQAHTLDALFSRLITRAAKNEGQYLDAAEKYYRLALRAQNQCRATIETLALVKNPPNLSFVKQANIGQAVQVNNGTAPTAPETHIE